MKRLLSLLCGLAALAAPPAASALEFHQVGETLVLSGPVAPDDMVRLRNHLAVHPVALVLLHDSPGGDLWSGYQLANWIRQEGLPTALSGKCESACALVFLSGVERSFTDGKPLARTMVGLHGAYALDTHRPLPQLSPRMASMIRTLTDSKYPDDLLRRTVYTRNAEDIVYAFHPARYDTGGRGVVECLRQEVDFKCTMLPGLDALGIGVITNPEVMRLPEDVKQLLQTLS